MTVRAAGESQSLRRRLLQVFAKPFVASDTLYRSMSMSEIDALIGTFIVSVIVVGAVLLLVVLYTYVTLNPLLWKVKLALGEWKAARLRTSQVRGYAANGVGASRAHELSVMRAASQKGKGGGKFFKATVEAYPTAKAVDVASDSMRTNTGSADLELSLLRAYLQAVEVYNAARTDLPECIGVWMLGNNIFPRWDARVPFPNNGPGRKSNDSGPFHGKHGGKSFSRRRGNSRRR